MLGTDHERKTIMVPLYAARVSDLGPGDFVKVECIACGYDLLITGQRIATGAGAAAIYKPVLDLERRLRCRECDRRGSVALSIMRAEGSRT